MFNKSRNISIEDAQIFSKNFSGREGQYNAEGVRNFCVILPDNIADKLAADGWNVKYLEPRDENESPKPYVQVAVRYGNIPPKIVLMSHGNRSILNEEMVGMLDYADLEMVDLVINPSRWEMSGRTGIKAYLKTMYATMAEDEFEAKYYKAEDSAMDVIGGCGRCEECDGHCGGGL